MDDLEGKIESVLSSPEAMEKVKSIMRALKSEKDDAPDNRAEEPITDKAAKSSPGRHEPSEPKETEAAPPPESSEDNTDDDSSDLLSSLLGGLGGMGGLGGLSALSNLDPKLISGLLGLLSEYNKNDDERENLMRALKPYLRTERRHKLDRAAHLMKLARTARSGFSLFLGGEDDA